MECGLDETLVMPLIMARGIAQVKLYGWLEREKLLHMAGIVGQFDIPVLDHNASEDATPCSIIK